jgi:hypothetical protein
LGKDASAVAELGVNNVDAWPDALAKIGHVARAARAEVPNRRATQHTNYQQTPFFDRFSIKRY